MIRLERAGTFVTLDDELWALVLPLAIVAGWSLMERDIGGRLSRDTRASAEEARALLAASGPDGLEPRLGEIASASGSRIRVVRADGAGYRLRNGRAVRDQPGVRDVFLFGLERRNLHRR